jgi:hypothetical protein
MSALNNSLLLGQEGGGGYAISRSLRFSSSDSSFLSRTPASAGNRKTWTYSFWFKLAKVTGYQYFLSANDPSGSGSNYDILQMDNNASTIAFYGYNGSSFDWLLSSDAVFRDPSAWQHFVISFDTTQSTASNRVKWWHNGNLLTLNRSGYTTYPSLNTESRINNTVSQRISDQTYGLSSYVADIHFCDGTAYDASAFGEFDANGIWQPKKFAGVYGASGFKLSFSDNSTAAALGTDTSGNGNTWTVNNISVSTGGPTSVAAASGALPVYNTTDTYGATKGTGVRSDSLASSLVACFPLADSSGLISTDESPTGRTSSTKSSTLTTVSHSTGVSKFYGGSANLTAATSKIDFGDSNDFSYLGNSLTVEGWFYASGDGQLFSKGNTGTGSSWIYEYFVTISGGYIGVGASPDGTQPGGNWAIYQAAIFPLNTWNHVALVINTSIRLYLNGISVGSFTGFIPGSTLNTSAPLVIGSPSSDRSSFIGYVQDFRVYKGSTAKYTSNFNPPSATQNATIAVGNDSLVDVPTNGSEVDTGSGGQVRGNYCTLNPLDKGGGASSVNGNLDLSLSSAGSIRSTIGMSSGKWFFEVTVGATSLTVGIAKSGTALSAYLGSQSNEWSYGQNASKITGGSGTSYGVTFTTGDVIGTAFDADNGTLTFYKNGSSQGTAFTGLTSGPYFFAVGDNSATSGHACNYGQRPFAYTAPSGFKALCTANLPAPLVTKPSDVMDVKLYTGNGSTQTISGLGFSPDFLWFKARSIAYSHALYDTVRGYTKSLVSNSTVAEGTEAGGLSAFNSDGFSLNGENTAYGSTNTNGQTYVAWAFDAGSSTVTNTAGSISSQVRANASAGFSIVTYTGNASAATVGHGLGVAPSLVIIKDRDAAKEWPVYHASLGSGVALLLNSTLGQQTSSAYFNGTAPTSTVFSVGTSQTTGGTNDKYVAYCFAPVAGYSSFGSYTGNGSADGPFVYTGFRPRFVMHKRTDSTSVWQMWDVSRSPYNETRNYLLANASDAEVAGPGGSGAWQLDILSNGFKIRADGVAAQMNASGGTYVYCAFAESPFQYARAR